MIRLVLGGEKSGKSDMAYAAFCRAVDGVEVLSAGAGCAEVIRAGADGADARPETGTAMRASLELSPDRFAPAHPGAGQGPSRGAPAPAQGRILAMGLAQDMAFRRQILKHRQARDPRHRVVEPGLELPSALAQAVREGGPVLVDSLDFWVFACMEAGQDKDAELLDSLGAFAAPRTAACVLVSCEVGLGPLAATPLSRRFVRRLGALNQRLAALAQDVTLAVAGLPLILKGS